MKRWGFLLLTGVVAVGASVERAGAQGIKPLPKPPARPPAAPAPAPRAAAPAMAPVQAPAGQCVMPPSGCNKGEDCQTCNYRLKVVVPPTTNDKVYNRADPKHGPKAGHPKDNSMVDAVVERNYGSSQNARSNVPGAKVSQKDSKASGGSRAGGPKPNTWGAEEAKAQMAAVQANPNPTSNWVRMSSANSPQFKVNSCDDYVYQKYYDHERWLDSIYACGKDQFCKASVTLQTSTPGIAGHALKRGGSDPKEIKVSSTSFSDTPELTGKIPRNAFFAGTGYFLTDSLVKAFASDPNKQASVQRLVTAVRTGFTTYVIGTGSGGSAVLNNAQGFKDEWDFHRVMLGRVQGIKPGEFREYGARGASLITAMDSYFTAAACGSGGIKCLIDNPNLPNALGQFPGAAKSPWEEDAFMSRAVHGNVDRNIATDMQKYAKSHPNLMSAYDDGIDPGSGLSFPGLLGSSTKPDTAPPAGMTHVSKAQVAQRAPYSMAVDNSQSSALNTSWAAHPPRIDTSSTTPRLQCTPPSGAVPRMQLMTRGRATNTALSAGMTDSGARTAGPNMAPTSFQETFAGEVEACEAVNLILDEWSRLDGADKQPNCFDGSNYACDWSPKDFQRRWVNNFLNYGGKDKNDDYKDCTMVSTALNWNFADWKAAQDKIAEKVKELKKILKDFPVLRKNTFGQDIDETQSFGNDTIGAGYHYDVGWEVPFFQRLDKTNVPCAFGARVHGDFDAFFYAFGSGDQKLINIGLGINSNDTDRKANEKGDYKGHISILGNELFDVKETDLPIHQANAKKNKQKPKARSGGDTDPVFEVDFPVWIVVVSLYADVGFDYHGSLKATSEVPKLDICDDEKKLFKADGSFYIKAAYKPSAGADLDAGLAASLGGVLGAKLQCDLNLVDLSMPFRADAGLLPGKDKKKPYPYLGLEQTLDAQVRAFSGDVWLYITGPFNSRLWGKELAGWDGTKWSHSLFKTGAEPIELALIPEPLEPREK